MKRIFQSVLLVLFLWQAGGVAVLLSIQQIAARVEAHNKMSRHHGRTETLVLNVAEYASAKQGDEICFNNKRYDVCSRQLSDGKVILEVIHDKNEETVLKRMKNLFSSNDTKNVNLLERLMSLLQMNYLLPATTIHAYFPLSVVRIPFGYSESIPCYINEIPSPPPWLS